MSSDASLTPTIFHERWWLDIACDGNYREVTVESGGLAVGRLPYLIRTSFGQTALGMPLMTHVLGPAVSTTGTASSRLLREIAITSDLIARLPKAAHVSFRLHGATSNTLAFDVAGFSNGLQYTIVIDPEPPEILWRRLRDKTRNVIRRAQERLEVRELADPDQFLDFYEANLRLRGTSNRYQRSICKAIIEQSRRRGVGRMLATLDSSGQFQSAIFSVWDHHAEYYFMSTRAARCMNGATNVLIWNAIQHAAQRGLCFDMDGVHVIDGGMPNLLMVSGFGGKIVPRFVVRRTSVLTEAVRYVRGFRPF